MKDDIENLASELGLTIEPVFIPWSKSRYNDQKDPSLNWRVTLRKGDREVLTTDYTAGCAHCPGYKLGRLSVMDRKILFHECETGKPSSFTGDRAFNKLGAKPIVPDMADVLACLMMEAEAIDHPTFEDWAEATGYDADSRKAEAIYRACLETALRLRAALGEDAFRRLREACADY